MQACVRACVPAQLQQSGPGMAASPVWHIHAPVLGRGHEVPKHDRVAQPRKRVEARHRLAAPDLLQPRGHHLGAVGRRAAADQAGGGAGAAAAAGARTSFCGVRLAHATHTITDSSLARLIPNFCFVEILMVQSANGYLRFDPRRAHHTTSVHACTHKDCHMHACARARMRRHAWHAWHASTHTRTCIAG